MMKKVIEKTLEILVEGISIEAKTEQKKAKKHKTNGYHIRADINLQTSVTLQTVAVAINKILLKIVRGEIEL